MSNIYACTALTGGGSGALDSIDGANLSNLDAAMVTTGDKTYHYTLDADNAGSDDGLNIIAPDTNPGDKRWVLVNVQGGGLTYEVISSGQTAQIGRGYLLNPSAALTVTLPASPSEGDTVAVVDAYNKATTYLLTVARNGSYIEGQAQDLIIDVDGAGFTLVYADATRGWEIVSEIGAGTTATFDYSNFVDRGDPSAYDFAVGDFTQDSSWHDLDLSSIIPSNAVAVVLYVQVRSSTANKIFYLRANGNSNAIALSKFRVHIANQYADYDCICPVDANQILEYNADTSALDAINISVRGWFTDDQVTLTTGGGVTGQFKNKIINGNFDIWQRGTGAFTGNEYTADRWRVGGTGSTHSVSRQSFTVGQTDVPNEPAYYLQDVVTSSAGASNYSAFTQRIEDVRTFAGQTCTLSFWAKADSSKNIAVEFVQNFGSGGSAEVNGVRVTTFSLTSSWQKFTTTVTLPSISGKTLGTSHYLNVFMWFDAGSDYNSRTNSLGQQSGTFNIAQVQLESGSSATDLEIRSIGQEFVLCQRYYEMSYEGADPTDTSGLENFRATGSHSAGVLKSHKFRVTKRTTPTITVYSYSTGTSAKLYNLTTTTDIGGGSNFVGINGFCTTIESGTISDQDFVRWHWDADAEL